MAKRSVHLQANAASSSNARASPLPVRLAAMPQPSFAAPYPLLQVRLGALAFGVAIGLSWAVERADA
eukprot:447211-Amphidinium_carterae.2